MKVLIKILVGLVIVVTILVAVGLLLPSEVYLERTITVDAPPSEVYEQVNSFQNFNKWSPWAQIDPDTEYSYSGPATGVGAKMSWASENPDVGNGSQEIVESVQNQLVKNKLLFDGFEPSYASLKISPDGGGSSITWSFEGDMGANPIGRYFGLFMDSMLGPMYEEGLTSLKDLVESK